jgi:hypothetical protein
MARWDTFPRLSIEEAFRHAQAHSHEAGERVRDALEACAPQPCTRAGLISMAIVAIAALAALAIVLR